MTFTILLVSANTVSMSVRERTRETAILRTLGYTPGEILGLILTESVLVSLLGGVAGIGIGWALARGIAAASGGFGVQGVKWQGGRDRARHGTRDRPGRRARAGGRGVAEERRRVVALHGVSRMGVPINYNLRNLAERKGHDTDMTAVGIGMTVAVLVVAVARSRAACARVFARQAATRDRCWCSATGPTRN